jgi:DNA-binding MarR family transcriptional regulator
MRDHAAMAEERPGFGLAMLLAGAFRIHVDALHSELSELGHAEARPIHGFALQAIGAGGASVADLGRRLKVSRQAASKTVAGLERAGYATRAPHPVDRRAVLVRRTARGDELLAISAAVFAELRAKWAQELGADRLAQIEDDLSRIIAGEPHVGDLPGLLR